MQNEDQKIPLHIVIIIAVLVLAYQFMGPHVDAERHTQWVYDQVGQGVPAFLFFFTPN